MLIDLYRHRKHEVCTGEVAQLVKHSPYKYEDLNFNPNTHIKSQVWGQEDDSAGEGTHCHVWFFQLDTQDYTVGESELPKVVL